MTAISGLQNLREDKFYFFLNTHTSNASPFNLRKPNFDPCLFCEREVLTTLLSILFQFVVLDNYFGGFINFRHI